MKKKWLGAGILLNMFLGLAAILGITPTAHAFADNKQSNGKTTSAGGVPICDCTEKSSDCHCTTS
jgi:hypothetical protein